MIDIESLVHFVCLSATEKGPSLLPGNVILILNLILILIHCDQLLHCFIHFMSPIEMFLKL